MMKNKKICRKLVESGAKINVGDKFGHTPLHAAIQYNDEEIIDILLYREEVEINK